jgi:hypothetical protein
MTKALLIIITFLSLSTSLFGYLSYSFYGDRQSLGAQLVVAQQAVLDGEIKAQNARSLVKATDTTVSEYIAEKGAVDAYKESSVKAIESLPRKCVPTKVSAVDTEVKHEYADIDSHLSPSLTSTFERLY